VPTDFVAQECFPQSSVSDPPTETSYQCPPPEKLADENGQGGDPACLDALDDAKTACGLGQDDFLDITELDQGSSSELLPICEALTDWASEFTCDPWSGWRKRPLFDPAEQAEFDDLFDSDPNDSGWVPPDPKNDPTDPAIPILFPFPSADEANEPIRVIRAEVPGNTLRFWLENAAVKPLLQQIDTQQGVDCDVSDLACDFDVLDMQDLSESIAQDFDEDGEGIHFEVTKTEEGYEIHDIEFRAIDPESIAFTARFTGNVTITADGPMSFDLDERALLRLLPVHDPENANGYSSALGWPDAQVSHLDRVVLYTGLTDEVCQLLSDLEYESQALDEKYYTFSTPFLCRCNPVNEQPTRYCISEPYPRPLRFFTDGADDPGATLPGEAHTVYCSAKDPLEQDPNTATPETYWVDALALPGAADPPLLTTEAKIESFAPAKGISPAVLPTVIEDIRSFGCSAQYATRLDIGPQTILNLGNMQVQIGQRVSSAIGVEAGAEIQMPTIVSEVSPGLVELDFELGTEARRWFEENFWTFPLGWILELVLEIFSAIASILSTITLNLIEPVSTVEFGDLELLVHGIVSHRNAEEVPPDFPSFVVVTPEIQLGVRRLASNIPEIDVTAFDLAPDFDADSCSLENPDDFVDWALALFVCPFEVISNLAKLGATPIVLLLKGLGEILIDVFVAPQEAIFDAFVGNVALLEEETPLGGLIAGATRTTALLPYYLEPGTTPAEAPDQLGIDLEGLTPAEAARRLGGTLPPPFSALCLGSNATSVNCWLAKILLGSVDARLPQIDLVRMGAKTSYRSFQDLTGDVVPVSAQDYTDEGLSWDFPPVRYCVEGDTPPAATNYTSGMLALDSIHDYLSFGFGGVLPLLDQLSTLDEIEVSSESDTTPTDWRAQCAAFVDMRITSLYFVRAIPNPANPTELLNAQLLVQPTKRTNFLLDEVFLCKDDASCDPTQPALRERGELAACSIAADFWTRVCGDPNCTGNPPYENLLRQVTASPSDLAWVVALLQQLAVQAGQSELAPILGSVGTQLAACVTDLEGEGYTIPETLVVAPP
jgi:hypothetical protein